jgi:hypothetical protein
VYRSKENGKLIPLNKELIKPVKAPSPTDAVVDYEFIDPDVTAGKDYYYIIEEVGKDNIRTRWQTPWKRTAQAIPPVEGTTE